MRNLNPRSIPNQGLGLRWMLLAMALIAATMYMSNLEQEAWKSSHGSEVSHGL